MEMLLSPVPAPPPPPHDGLRVVFHGGPFDGRTQTTRRDALHISFGNHYEPAWSVVDFYDRTTRLDFAGRTIFQYAAHAVNIHPPLNSNRMLRILSRQLRCKP